MNNPTIYSIEYVTRGQCTIRPHERVEVSSSNFSGEWSSLEIAPNSGELSDSESTDQGGNKSHSTTVRFFIPGTSAEQKNELNDLSDYPHVYRITDGEGKQYIVGSDIFRAYLNYGEAISATAAGRKGYNCEIRCRSIAGPLSYSAS